MDYQIHRPITEKRPSNKQKHANDKNFANEKNDFFAKTNVSNPKAKLSLQTQNQPQEHNYNEQLPNQHLNQ